MHDGLTGAGIVLPLDRQADRRRSTLQQTRLDAGVILLPYLSDCCCSTCNKLDSTQASYCHLTDRLADPSAKHRQPRTASSRDGSASYNGPASYKRP